MADKPSDSPEFKKEQVRMAAENAGDSVAAGVGHMFKTWLCYDEKKRSFRPVGTLIDLALISCVTGFVYDVANDMTFPDPGHDSVLEQSLKLSDSGQGYQALVAEAGGAPIVIVRGESGGYQLYREEAGPEGTRELTLITNRAEAALVMERVANALDAAQATTEGSEAAAGFTPYEIRYDDISVAYKDRGDIQRQVTRPSLNAANPSALTPATAGAISDIWQEAATNVRAGQTEYGIPRATAQSLQEQEDFDKNFSDGWKYSMLGFIGLRFLSGLVGGVAVGASQASAGRRRRKALENRYR